VSEPEVSAMTASSVDKLDPATVRGLVARAGDPKRERWLQQIRHTGACRHPVRLRGVVMRGDERMYSTADEPDGALMVRCGNRREACCPSCAYDYRGDMWQLVYAGLAGGRKGVPEQVAEHPQVFASLTAPSFGAVHGRSDDGRACRCGQRHDADDPRLGEAIDPASYDYEGAVLWNWHAPALWNRFTVELVRALAARAGLSERQWRKRVRLAFAKVAEFQARGMVHFHAIIRLDGAEDRATAPGVTVPSQELEGHRRRRHRPRSAIRLRAGRQRWVVHTRWRLHIRDAGGRCPSQASARRRGGERCTHRVSGRWDVLLRGHGQRALADVLVRPAGATPRPQVRHRQQALRHLDAPDDAAQQQPHPPNGGRDPHLRPRGLIAVAQARQRGLRGLWTHQRRKPRGIHVPA
jgi:hypothetical protein